LMRACKRGEQMGLSREFVTRYLDAVHMESINHQNKIMNS
jgi:chorismate mutase